jgi:putative transposase
VLHPPVESGQYTSREFAEFCTAANIHRSVGRTGVCWDNAAAESFWSRMQVELLDRQRWKTRIELANAIFDYLEIWHNRRRRHSQLGMLTPIAFERNRIVTVA